MFLRICVLKTFVNFTEKQLCCSLNACNFIKKRLQHMGYFYRTPPVAASKELRVSQKNLAVRCLRISIEFL